MTTTPDAVVIGDAWLVRHAATAWTGVRWCGRADPPLSGAGVAAAKELARRVVTEVPAGAIVVSSPAERARATAAPIAAALGSAVHILDGLIEMDVGRAEGLTWQELSAEAPDVTAAIASGQRIDWPGGESAAEVDARAVKAASDIAALAAGRPAVVVSHGGLLRALAIAFGRGEQAVHLDPCGVIRLRA